MKMPCKRMSTIVCLIAFLVGCVSTPTHYKFESESFSEQMGLQPGCWISTPLSPAEVVESSKRDGNPNPEADGDWIKIDTSLQAGDQLRLVSCSGGGAYYALIRDNAIMLKFYPMLFD